MEKMNFLRVINLLLACRNLGGTFSSRGMRERQWTEILQTLKRHDQNYSKSACTEARVSLKKFLEKYPDDWEALHTALNFLKNAGYVNEAKLFHIKIEVLKERLRKEQGLDRLGFSVISSSYCRAVGNMAILDLVIKGRALGWLDLSNLLILAPPENVANETLLGYLSNHILIKRDKEAVGKLSRYGGLSRFSGLLHLNQDPEVFWAASHKIQAAWEESARTPLFILTQEHREAVSDFLFKKGLGNRWHVCLHVRTPDLYNDEWSLRNADIDTYRKAIQKIREAGGGVVRMGDSGMPPLKGEEGVVDYALSSEKSPLLDIGLVGRARFFLGTASGLGHVATMFGVPGLFTNWMPWGILPWSCRDLFVPKLLRNRHTGRLLKIDRALSEPYGFIQDRRFLDAHGLVCEDNSPDDLAAATMEMIQATLEPRATAHQSPAQEAFEKAEQKIGICHSNSRICDSFVKRHPELIS